MRRLHCFNLVLLHLLTLLLLLSTRFADGQEPVDRVMPTLDAALRSRQQDTATQGIGGRPLGMPIRLVQRSSLTNSGGTEQGDGAEQGGAADGAASPAAAPLPLEPPTTKPDGSVRGGKSTTGAVVTVVGSLFVVLGAFFVVVWLSRRAFPKAASGLPSEALELLGQTSFHGRQILQLVRVGNKILLVTASASQVQTLTEITDSAEVDRLVALCRRSPSDSVASAFRQVLGPFSGEQGPARSARAGLGETSPVRRRRAAIEV